MNEDLSAYIDTAPFWVIWQVNTASHAGQRIRRISDNYKTESRANADADRYRKSGAITWVEEARPLTPSHVPAEALEALAAGAVAPERDSVAIGSVHSERRVAPAAS